VSIRKEEIEASGELFRALSATMERRAPFTFRASCSATEPLARRSERVRDGQRGGNRQRGLGRILYAWQLKPFGRRVGRDRVRRQERAVERKADEGSPVLPGNRTMA
jgi:hypothetical protein